MVEGNGRVSVARRIARRLMPGEVLRLVLRQVLGVDQRVALLERRVDAMRAALGRIEARQLAAGDGRGEAQGDLLAGQEFQVFSQWGEDGILQYLARTLALSHRTFVEFGVESYEEANTRFLLVHDGWSGLVIDPDPEHVERIRRSREFWLYDLQAVCERVTRENINELFAAQGMGGDLGLVSIDVDGVDWWLWEALEVARPAVVVVEYNHRFGPTDSVTVPYSPDFERRAAHPSLCFFGASLEALTRLALRKGYALVGCGRAGVNAFFVRSDLLVPPLRGLSAAEAFVGGRFREAHDAHGRRLDLPLEEERRLARSLPLVQVGPDGYAELTP
jgi:hypothetical protein